MITPPSASYQVQVASDGSGLHPVAASFILKNLGTQPISVLGIEKSCGCAQLNLQPSPRVGPGSEAELSVSIDPPLHGERFVTLVLSTDSPESPRLTIPIQVRTDRAPPFLAAATGDLSFRTLSHDREGRSFQVSAIVDERETREPRATCDLPGSRLRLVSRRDDPRAETSKDRVVRRHWFHNLSFPDDTDSDYRGGTVTITDPWNVSAPALTIGVMRTPSEGPRIVPERLVFSRSQQQAMLIVRQIDSSFTLTTSCSAPAIEVVRAPKGEGEDQSLLLRRIPDREVPLGLHELEVIASNGTTTHRMKVPIRVVEGVSHGPP